MSLYPASAEKKLTMGTSADEEKIVIIQPLLDDDDDEEEKGSRKGGLRTIPFILVTQSLEKVASAGLRPNMILYLTEVYQMEMVGATKLLFYYSSVSGFTTVIGAVIADSLTGRYPMVGIGSIFCLLGMANLWLTTMIPQARAPGPCNEPYSSSFSPATPLQLFLLYSYFGFMSIGSGGISSSGLAFGADQLIKEHDMKDTWILEHYFSWFYASYTLSVFVALSGMVYIQEKFGWRVGFGIPAILMFVSALLFFVASPFYVKLKPKSSLIIGMIRVAVAAYRKRHVNLSSEIIMYLHKQESLPSQNLRFLNKACIILDPQQDLTADGEAQDPWRLCTIDQVEELKILLRVIPLWSTGMIMSVNISQGSFLVIQANSMNRKIGKFEIPAGSFSTFSLIALMLWIGVYQSIILPVASRTAGRPVHLSSKQRMGLGILLSLLCVMIIAIVEATRRNLAIREGHADDPNAVVNMSAMWLIPQHILIGLSEGIAGIAQYEFYFSEFPSSMSSIASALSLLSYSVANLLSSLIMNTIDSITKSGGKTSWISSNINQGHYDYYFCVLVGLSILNMIYFLACSKAYGPSKVSKEENNIPTADGESRQ